MLIIFNTSFLCKIISISDRVGPQRRDASAKMNADRHSDVLGDIAMYTASTTKNPLSNDGCGS